MRSDASALSLAGTATVPGGSTRVPPEEAPARISASAASALTQRLTRLLVEEVHACCLDGDLNLLVDAELNVRRELRDQVRPLRDDAFAGELEILPLLFLLPLADHVRVDAEVDDRLAAECFDELDAH